MIKLILYTHLLLIAFSGVQAHRIERSKEYSPKDTVIVTDTALYKQIKLVWEKYPLKDVKEPVIILYKQTK